MNTVNINDVCDRFIADIDKISDYIEKCKNVFREDKRFLSLSYENGIIQLYKAFEKFILRSLISCLNHDHSFFESKYGIKLGKHINDDVCEFLITKGGYFDFRGRSGLIKVLKNVIGENHAFSQVIKDAKYTDLIEQMCAMRNYAAHISAQSKTSAKNAMNLSNISSAGSCLKSCGRLEKMLAAFSEMANDIKSKNVY